MELEMHGDQYAITGRPYRAGLQKKVRDRFAGAIQLHRSEEEMPGGA